MPENVGFEDAALAKILSQLDGMVDAAAGQMGMPPGGKRYTQAEIDDEWSYSPVASPDERLATMMQMRQQGMSDEEITDQVYPNRRRLITTGRPRIADQIAFATQQRRRMDGLLRQVQEQQQPPQPLDQPAGVQAHADTAAGAPMPAPMMPPPLPDPGPTPPPTPAPQPAGSMLDMLFLPLGG